MLGNPNKPTFHVVPGETVGELLSRDLASTIGVVAQCYLDHEAGRTTNPDSYFLRFPDNPANRIIALPAAIHGESGVSGIKWISSFPGNIACGLQRASAVLILNDAATGYPIAVLEGARISAVRTAASTVLGAYWLNRRCKSAGTLAVVGSGFIARNIIDMFAADGWAFGEVLSHDLDKGSADRLTTHAEGRFGCPARTASLAQALDADLVVFATNAGTPYVPATSRLRPDQILLNISLRDLAPELILQCQNVFDDVSHCLKANTSPHLAEQLSGSRDFVTGTIGAVMRGETALTAEKAVIYSPFGMGILDLALGLEVLERAIAEGGAVAVPGFFGDVSRW
ncbi:MAG: 2,3-diaminopropionate biosynthesis protein SbnB [Paracoccus sp. (in: a-proteobacteria)]|uniref:2,3-diaminopropionate biosynthesis protein SbnB n=1 Tax=Paracoccus sp. TaxID=267 RepID=UPI0026E08B9F|nr:2,3-diaminopropionate biosynthesis protein SbnB [Paracoccus sp. (in: a-proteobacteria)]MDO5622902.1 2,3-diaminopropionate biosynthesis protein SbnB [Paracoccus sp. (in: a-proteobacteria)]